MPSSPCSVCGVSPCYLMCPTQDPYAGNPIAEHEDHEASAAYDSMMERFGQELDAIDSDDIPADDGPADPSSLASLSWQSGREIRRIAEQPDLYEPPADGEDILF